MSNVILESSIPENNRASVIGRISGEFTFNHEVLGERFFITHVEIPRLSGVCDTIPVMVSERLTNINENCDGKPVVIDGHFRSYNLNENEKHRLVLSLFVKEIEFIDEESYAKKVYDSAKTNKITLDGFICKTPVYRKTPKGREIADILLAVNRPYSKSDYIPCILWGRNAKYASSLSVGTRCVIQGRMQSREYSKKLGEDTFETRIAYEISVERVRVIDSQNNSGEEKEDDSCQLN